MGDADGWVGLVDGSAVVGDIDGIAVVGSCVGGLNCKFLYCQ